MRFGEVIDALKRNDRAIARRAGWNASNMAIAYMPPKELAASAYTPRTSLLLALFEHHLRHATTTADSLQVDGYFVLFTSRGTWQPGWVASQADMLAEDWEVLLALHRDVPDPADPLHHRDRAD